MILREGEMKEEGCEPYIYSKNQGVEEEEVCKRIKEFFNKKMQKLNLCYSGEENQISENYKRFFILNKQNSIDLNNHFDENIFESKMFIKNGKCKIVGFQTFYNIGSPVYSGDVFSYNISYIK
jgi:hypothetical protein